MTIDTDLLSTREVAPVPADPPGPASNKLILECPDCGAKANKLGVPFVTRGQVGTHRANVHGYRAPAPTKKAPAKKAAAPKSSAAPKASSPSPTPRTPAKTRKPLGESLARLVLQVGRIINQVEPPTGAVIMFEAGALGAAIDNAIAGSFIDAPLQKISGSASKIEPLIPLLTLPAMVFMAGRDEHMAKMLESEMREAVEDVLVQSLPMLKKRAQRTRETLDALEELQAMDPKVYGSSDPIGVILESFFDGVVPGEDAAEPDDGES